MRRHSLIYKTATGTEPYAEYLDSLADREGAAKIRTRVVRAELGNLGDHRGVGRGVIELRVHHGPGYRIYIGLHGQELIILLCAGDKSSQGKDIQKALGYWKDYEATA